VDRETSEVPARRKQRASRSSAFLELSAIDLGRRGGRRPYWPASGPESIRHIRFDNHQS